MEKHLSVEFPSKLQKRFEDEIVSHGLEKGQVIDLAGLASQLGASATELRLVLAAAYRKGLIEPRNGSYVVLGKSDARLDSLFQHAAKTGHTPTSEVRAVVIEPAFPAAVEKLQVELGAPLYRLERTRRVDNQVVANQVNYIPLEVCPGLENDDMSRFSFQVLLEDKYNAITVAVNEQITLDPATPEDEKILGLAPGKEVLVIHRVSVSVTNLPLVWANIHINPDCYHFVEGLWPGGAALLSKTT